MSGMISWRYVGLYFMIEADIGIYVVGATDASHLWEISWHRNTKTELKPNSYFDPAYNRFHSGFTNTTD